MGTIRTPRADADLLAAVNAWSADLARAADQELRERARTLRR
jgi:hypothetical protein